MQWQPQWVNVITEFWWQTYIVRYLSLCHTEFHCSPPPPPPPQKKKKKKTLSTTTSTKRRQRPTCLSCGVWRSLLAGSFLIDHVGFPAPEWGGTARCIEYTSHQVVSIGKNDLCYIGVYDVSCYLDVYLPVILGTNIKQQIQITSLFNYASEQIYFATRDGSCFDVFLYR